MLDIKDFSQVMSCSRTVHLTHAFSQITTEGIILEFGVYKGQTINHIATLTDELIHGFDSFKSLPEPWVRGGNFRVEFKQRFKVDKIPEVASNVRLYEGWFKDTIPPWKKDWKDNIKFLHIDSDIYSSCKTILTELNTQIIPGTIIVFDEMFGYPNYKDHEWKACDEWLEEFNREIKPISKTHKWAAAVKVTK
jgi:hypothetical protein